MADGWVFFAPGHVPGKRWIYLHNIKLKDKPERIEFEDAEAREFIVPIASVRMVLMDP